MYVKDLYLGVVFYAHYWRSGVPGSKRHRFGIAKIEHRACRCLVLVHRRLDNTYVSLASKGDSDVISVCDDSWASRASCWPVVVQIFIELAE
jgi:hypothetical protein